jgi:LuxR family maltose regulon positive regulatory protein
LDTTLSTTKLYTPPLCQTLVVRPTLIAALAAALTHGLTIVSAPAGYGKTTLVSHWLRVAGLPSAWISLDEGDNDPVRFLHYFLVALGRIIPTIKPDLLGMLQGPPPASFDPLVNLLINEIAANDRPFVLVLDDFHSIHAQPVLEFLAALLDHLPPQMHLVLLTRADPPLPVSRLRVRNQLVDIRADQLRFTLAETADFLNEQMGLRLSSGDLAALEARTEGWIAGLQLAALSLQGCRDVHGFVSAFSGSHRYIMDYLADEVLERQPERARSFLLQTAILERLAGPLCQAVVEPAAGEPGAGQAMLEDLDRRRLFLISLDDERRWYRYHHLFADVLRRNLEHLSPQLVPELHRRASRWFEQNGFIAEAARHALQAGDRERAASLVEQHGCDLLMRGEATTLLNMIVAVEPYWQTRPWLALQKAWALNLTGQPDQVEPALEAAERQIPTLEPTVEAQDMLGGIAAARAHHANLQGESRLAADCARQALEHLTEGNPFSASIKSVATSVLGDASWISGDLDQAYRAYADAVQIGRAANNIHLAVVASINLAAVLTEQGCLHRAARIYSEALRETARPDGRGSPLAAGALAGLAGVSYEWNQLEAAAGYACQCVELCRQWGNPNLLATGYATLAQLEHARCNLEGAQAAGQAAEQIVRDGQLSFTRSLWAEAALARLWLAEGDLDRAAHFVRRSSLALEDEIPYRLEPAYLIWLRVLLAQGDHEAALRLAERLLKPAEATGRTGRLIEGLVLQALARQGQRDTVQAVALLERAIGLAQPEGYRRVFLDEGEPVARLLYQAKSHRNGKGLAAELLAAMGQAAGREAPPAQLLIEPLTMRELEVLKLIEAGHSNQEIAARLVVSIATVKRHISNIYAKLGVQSRTQALARVRDLTLLG